MSTNIRGFASYDEPIRIRRVDGLTVVFYDRYTVYAKKDCDYIWTIYNRWGVRQRFFYTRNFRPFLKSLKYNRHLTIPYITKLATRYELNINGATSLPQFEREVVELPSKGRRKNAN